MGAGADRRVDRLVASSPPSPGGGPGWGKVAEAVEAAMPPAEIETIYLFRPYKRDGREWGTAVVTRRSREGRLRVYTAKYMLVVRGKERGRATVAVEEVALSPADVVERVMRAAADRMGDADPPVAVGPGVWYEG
jgi:hypothetical protein